MRTNAKFEAVTTYLAIFCLAEIFEVYITLEALFQSNIVQVGLSASLSKLSTSSPQAEFSPKG